jgi:hypothetical protein
LQEDEVEGEVLCKSCFELTESGKDDQADLRLACEACVLERWRLEDAS